MKTNPWAKGLLLFLLISLALWMARGKTYSYTPETTFTTITGEQIVLKTLRGKPVLVTFWATSCPSCVKEIPHLIALYDRFHPQGFEIIAITMAYDPPSHVVAMTKERKLPYHVVLDVTSGHAKAFGRIWATPTTLLISPDGAIAKREVGAFDLTEMESRIEHLLKG
jgi:peroxiredoxin